MRMSRTRLGSVLVLALMAAALAPVRGQQPARPLSEEGLVKVIELQLGDDAITAKIRKDGVSFAVDDAAVARLKFAGASDAVIGAARQAGQAGARPAAGRAITYDDVLQLVRLGIPEPQILKRLEASPTTFVLDAAQADALTQAGASGALLAAIRGTRRATAPAGAVTDLAIILDCSGSMAEPTPEGPSKMATAQRVVTELVRSIPDGIGLSFVIYGQNREQACEAVRVARPLSPLDAAGKSDLAAIISGLRPVGATPIALSLRTAGAELARARGPRGVILITDGKETCGGNPAAEADALARAGSLTFGVNVVGFDVEGAERAAVEEIARAGRGRYYNAESAAQLRGVIQSVRREIEVAARPAPLGATVARRAIKTVKVLAPAIEFPTMEEVYVVPAGTTYPVFGSKLASGTHYGVELRLPPASNLKAYDVRWSPKDFDISQVIARNVPYDDTPALVVKPEEAIGLVQVVGNGLPRAQEVYLAPEGYTGSLPPFSVVQSSKGFGQIMPVAAGVYQVRFIAEGSDRYEILAEKVEVKPGRLTRVE